MTDKIDCYWAQFLETFPDTADCPQRYVDAFWFGMTKESAKLIAELTFNGVKTATGSVLWTFEVEGNPIPKVGDYNIVTDGEDNPICVIQDTEITIVPFDEVDAAFAWDGGEEDRTLESWRKIYWEFIVAECQRIDREPSLKTPLICERFRIVYKEPLKPEANT